MFFIAGEYDNTVPFSTIKEQVEITHANLTTLTLSGHMGFIEKQETSIKAIEDFISI